MVKIFTRQVDYTDDNLTRNGLNLLEKDVNDFITRPGLTVQSQTPFTEFWPSFTDGLVIGVQVEYNLRHK